MRTMHTYDELTAIALVQGDQATIQALLKHAHGTMPCPECGDEGPHDTNSAARYADNREFCCTSCGTNFEAPVPGEES
jgi:transposase-like protein